MSAPVVVAGFPIDGNVTLRKRLTHRDVSFEVSNHGRTKWTPDGMEDADGTWCYYVYLHEDMVPHRFEEFWLSPRYTEFGGKKRTSYDYTSASFADADWHHGITFYEKIGGHDGEARGVKLGCDFAHYWDEGRTYDFADVEREARQTVDALCDRFDILRRCAYHGSWQAASEMVEHKGRLLSARGLESVLKNEAERREAV